MDTRIFAIEKAGHAAPGTNGELPGAGIRITLPPKNSVAVGANSALSREIADWINSERPAFTASLTFRDFCDTSDWPRGEYAKYEQNFSLESNVGARSETWELR